MNLIARLMESVGIMQERPTGAIEVANFNVKVSFVVTEEGTGKPYFDTGFEYHDMPYTYLWGVEGALNELAGKLHALGTGHEDFDAVGAQKAISKMAAVGAALKKGG